MTNTIISLLTRDNFQQHYCATSGADCSVHFHMYMDTHIDHLPEPIHHSGSLTYKLRTTNATSPHIRFLPILLYFKENRNIFI